MAVSLVSLEQSGISRITGISLRHVMSKYGSMLHLQFESFYVLSVCQPLLYFEGTHELKEVVRLNPVK